MPPLFVVGLGLLAIPTTVGLLYLFARCEYTEWDFLCGPLMVTAILMGVFSIAGPLVGISRMWDKHVCEVRGTQLNVDTKWTWATGCVVKQSDRWLDLGKYRFEIGD